MGRAKSAAAVAVRRHGMRQKIISRLMFEPGPAIAGWVNYRNSIHPVFKDSGGRLFLNEDGWTAARQRPLKGDRDHLRTAKPDVGFGF